MMIGKRVRITGGMSVFVGKTGVVVGAERDGRILLHRVKLDEPVNVPGVGEVTDDLWAGEYLKAVRS